jgi:hypothetical protein
MDHDARHPRQVVVQSGDFRWFEPDRLVPGSSGSRSLTVRAGVRATAIDVRPAARLEGAGVHRQTALSSYVLHNYNEDLFFMFGGRITPAGRR